MNSIDDLIEYLKSEKLWQDRLGGKSDISIAMRTVYIQVIRKAEELKTNMEKVTEKASIPVTSSFAKQCTAAVEIIESGNMRENNGSRKT